MYPCCFNDTATTEISTLSLHDSLPILCHRDDGSHYQRRGGWGRVGLLGDYAEEPDERSHRGGRDQHHPDLLRRSARPDRRHGGDPRRNPRGGEAVPPLVPTRLGQHSRPSPSKLHQRSPSPFCISLYFPDLRMRYLATRSQTVSNPPTRNARNSTKCNGARPGSAG